MAYRDFEEGRSGAVGPFNLKTGEAHRDWESGYKIRLIEENRQAREEEQARAENSDYSSYSGDGFKSWVSLGFGLGFMCSFWLSIPLALILREIGIPGFLNALAVSIIVIFAACLKFSHSIRFY